MIPAVELAAAIMHVAHSARERLILMAPLTDPKVEAIIRKAVADGVSVEVVRHPRIKALVADDALGLILSGSLTPMGTGIAFVPFYDEDGNLVAAPNIEVCAAARYPGGGQDAAWADSRSNRGDPRVVRTRRRLTIVAPRVDDDVVEVLRGALREGVSIDVITDGPVHTKMIVTDEHVPVLTSGNFTTAGTTMGFTELEGGSSELADGSGEGSGTATVPQPRSWRRGHFGLVGAAGATASEEGQRPALDRRRPRPGARAPRLPRRSSRIAAHSRSPGSVSDAAYALHQRPL